MDILVLHPDESTRDDIAGAIQDAGLRQSPTVLTASTVEEARRHMRREQVLVIVAGGDESFADFAFSQVPHMSTCGSLLDRILVFDDRRAHRFGVQSPGVTMVDYEGNSDRIVALVAESCADQADYDYRKGIDR